MRTFVLILTVVALASCSKAYYGTMEKLGIHKRDILVDRVDDAKDAQKEGEEQFSSALERFKSIVSVDGGKLQETYDALNNEFEDSQAAAEKIRTRIDDIESVAEALFDEWRDELKLYSNASLRRESEQKLKVTRQRYAQLIGVMKKSEDLLEPVLDAMQDQVLYLKHNLNARAIASLKSEVPKIDRDVERLLAAMRVAMAEADVFIKDLKQQ